MSIWRNLVFVLASYSSTNAQTGNTCVTPNGETAVCVAAFNCQTMLKVVPAKNEDIVKFWKESQCGYEGDVLVCCGTLENYKNPPLKRTEVIVSFSETNNRSRNSNIPGRDLCGYQESNRISSGEDTEIDEFPWTAQLHYHNATDFREIGCGGTLISSRYVLTAAYCVQLLPKPTEGSLVMVRLGEWDTRTNPDCITVANRKKCNPPFQDIQIESIVFHGKFDRLDYARHNDIALIKLKLDVKYTSNVRPICLPLRNETSKDGDDLYVSGWSRMEKNTSLTKKKLRLPLANKLKCTVTYLGPKLPLGDKQICAGGETEDSCRSDIGGPLMRTTSSDVTQWYIEGIVSFGANCGTVGWPAVYTNVTSYLDWIYSNVHH